MDRAQVIRETWGALSRHDVAPLEAALAPDARWRAVEEGPWNCESRAEILEVMASNVARGNLSGQIEDIVEVGERIVVAFRPDHDEAGGWPLDDGIRYVVITMPGRLVTEIKGCADRATAFSYAETGRLS